MTSTRGMDAVEQQSKDLAAALGELELIYLTACDAPRDERAYLALSSYLDIVGDWIERDLPRTAVLLRTPQEFYLSTDTYLGSVVEVVLDGIRAVLLRGDQRRATRLVPLVINLVRRILALRPLGDASEMAASLAHKVPLRMLLRLARDVAHAEASDVMLTLLAGVEEILLELPKDADDGVRVEFGKLMSFAFEYGVERSEPMVSARVIDAAAQMLRRYASPDYGAPHVVRYPINIIGRALFCLVDAENLRTQGSGQVYYRYLGDSFAPGQQLHPLSYVFSGGTPARELERVLRACAVVAGRQESAIRLLIIGEIERVVMYWASNARRAKLESGNDGSGLVVCSGVLRVFGRFLGPSDWLIGGELLDTQTLIAIAAFGYELDEKGMIAILDAIIEFAIASRPEGGSLQMASPYSGVARLVVLSAIARQAERHEMVDYLFGHIRNLMSTMGARADQPGETARNGIRSMAEKDVALGDSTQWYKLAARLIDVKSAFVAHLPEIQVELGLRNGDE